MDKQQSAISSQQNPNVLKPQWGDICVEMAHSLRIKPQRGDICIPETSAYCRMNSMQTLTIY